MANRPYKRQNFPDVNATDDELRRYFIDEFQRIENALAPGSLRVNGTLEANRIDCFADGHQYGRQQLVLNAGEAADHAGTQEDERVYINAENGLEINSSPDNWASGWAGRDTLRITGQGIMFGGAVNSGGTTSSSNTLDDYEEGTWTPTAGSNVVSLSNPTGSYTKVGRLVTVNCSFTADLTSVGTFHVNGLPFTVSDLISNTAVEATGVAFSDNHTLISYASHSSNVLVFRDVLRGTQADNSFYRTSVTYMTDA
jgi:hypothetical protein